MTLGPATSKLARELTRSALDKLLRLHGSKGAPGYPKLHPGAGGAAVGPLGVDKKLVGEAEREFGYTENIEEAGYVMEDGRMLDFSGRNQGYDGPPMRNRDHREVGGLGSIETSSEDRVGQMNEFMSRTGGMRVHHGGGVLTAEVARPVTMPQRRKLVGASRGVDYFAVETFEGGVSGELDAPFTGADVGRAIDRVNASYERVEASALGKVLSLHGSKGNPGYAKLHPGGGAPGKTSGSARFDAVVNGHGGETTNYVPLGNAGYVGPDGSVVSRAWKPGDEAGGGVHESFILESGAAKGIREARTFERGMRAEGNARVLGIPDAGGKALAVETWGPLTRRQEATILRSSDEGFKQVFIDVNVKGRMRSLSSESSEPREVRRVLSDARKAYEQAR